ncbi:MAG: alpha/beta fold hydrolase [Longimicrobiales bacterium]
MSRRVRQEEVVAADGTRLALYRVGRPGAPTVVLMPGTFSNHTFWLGTKGHGMAWALADAGFEAVILDPRGHGGSERPNGQDWTFDHWGRVDVPAAVGAATAGGGRTLMVGHSAGGASMLIALAGDPEVRERVAGVVVLATPVPWLQRWRQVGAWAIRAGSRLLGRFPARVLGLGPEDELPGVMGQWMTWNLRGEWEGDDGVDYVRELGNVRVPVLALSGAGDTVFAPPDACRGLVEMVGTDDATYVLAGRDTGFSEDFDHPGIVVSKAAHEEVWPRVIDWLQDHSPDHPGG